MTNLPEDAVAVTDTGRTVRISDAVEVFLEEGQLTYSLSARLPDAEGFLEERQLPYPLSDSHWLASRITENNCVYFNHKYSKCTMSNVCIYLLGILLVKLHI